MTTPTTQDVRAAGYELKLAAVPEAVKAARWFVIATLHGWHVDLGVIDAVEVVTSELTTNAVERMRLFVSRTSGELEPKPLDAAVVWLRVRLDDQAVIVEVWDGDLTPPVVQEQNTHTEHGRGLLLVADLSEQWGCYWPPAGGKIVWARIGMPRTL